MSVPGVRVLVFFWGGGVILLRNVSASHSYAVVLSIMAADVQSHGATDGPFALLEHSLWMSCSPAVREAAGTRLGGVS